MKNIFSIFIIFISFSFYFFSTVWLHWCFKIFNISISSFFIFFSTVCWYWCFRIFIISISSSSYFFSTVSLYGCSIFFIITYSLSLSRSILIWSAPYPSIPETFQSLNINPFSSIINPINLHYIISPYNHHLSFIIIFNSTTSKVAMLDMAWVTMVQNLEFRSNTCCRF